MTPIRALEPEAKNWTDLTPCEVRFKRWMTITLVVVSIMIAIGITIGIYYCCTTTQSVTNSTGHVVQKSNAPYAIFQGVFGGCALITSICGALGTHYLYGQKAEDRRNHDELRLELLNNSITLDEVYQNFNLNIKPLVQKQLLTVSQAIELRTIFEEYELLKNLSTPLAKDKLRALAMRWSKIYQECFKQTEIFETQAPKCLPQKGDTNLFSTHLGEDVIAIIFDQLDFRDVKSASRVNVHFCHHANSAFERRARKMGYRGNGIPGARKYLHRVLKGVKVLVKEGVLLQKQLVLNTKGKIDFLATLELFFSLSAEERYSLKFQLNKTLIKYVKKGNVGIVESLLILGADPNYRDQSLKTALHRAMERMDRKTVQILLEKGANPNLPDPNGFTPICFNTSDPEMTQLLIKHGADVNYRLPFNQQTALDYAIRKKQFETASILQNHQRLQDMRNFASA